MKTVSILFCALLVSASTYAQEFLLSGKVTDSNNQPIENASVFISGTTTGTQTDALGNYNFSLEKEAYTLVVSYIGYVTQEQTIDLTRDVTLNFQLEESSEILDEVLVKAVRVDADSPITYSNISKEEIEDRNLGQDIPILLNFQPAVVTTSDAGAGIGYTGIRVRGSDATRVNVTINGIPYNDAESQGTFWVNLGDFASSTENIQLQRGVGTSVNGSGAFGASLNILTDAIDDKPYADFSGSVGSFNTRKATLKFGTGTLSDHFSISGRLSKIDSDGYIDRATSDLKGYFLQGAYKDENTLIKAITFGGFEETYQAYFGIDQATLETNRTFNTVGQMFDRDGNFEGYYQNEVDNYRQDHYQLLWNERYDNNWSTNVALNYTRGRGYFEQFVDEFYYTNILFSGDATLAFFGADPVTIDGEEFTTTDYTRRRWLDNNFLAVNANVNYKNDWADTTTGLFYSTYKGDHYGEILSMEIPIGFQPFDRYYDGDSEKNEITAFSKATFRLNDKWSVYGDLQLRQVDYEAIGGNDDLDVDEEYTFFNPKLGANYRLNESSSFYVSYARANREPNRTDFENGSPEPEQLDDYELGWRFNSGKFQLNSNVYYMNYKDQLVLTGAIDDVGSPIRANSGSSYRLGLELDASWQILDNLVWAPNLAISTNKNVDFVTSRDGSLVNLGNTDISYSPGVIAGSALKYIPVKDLELQVLNKYVGEQYLSNVEAPLSQLDSYFTTDFNVQYTFRTTSLFKEIVLTGLVNNVFNEEYVNNGYYFTFDLPNDPNPGVTTFEGAGFYPQATTNFLVGATLKF